MGFSVFSFILKGQKWRIVYLQPMNSKSENEKSHAQYYSFSYAFVSKKKSGEFIPDNDKSVKFKALILNLLPLPIYCSVNSTYFLW